eukprot:CAMPEP_0116861010 /NCGR_PEP_ID=MMETSP0418-20121206/22776_1 /TAXON_ID=1158023 /ORGANISM="Astrosyne radiata, Strain 13vi08-1A" /LENGTH=89 /DNA_ID=CAMNT_0004495567 /DNA_START=6 /DNA_END=272 /DNA_ORIENTATION=-
MEAIREELVPHFSRQYLTTNVFWKTKKKSDPKESIGSRYTLLRHDDTRVLVFGFLYNMMDTCELVQVQTMESLVEETWFRDVLTTEEFD